MKYNLTSKKVQFLFGLCLAAIFLPVVRATAEEKEPDTRGITINVDPRVELISIIFRLADYPEYNRGKYVSYNFAIEKQFGQYRKHPVVKLAKSLRKKYGVSYVAPMSLAIHLQDVNSLQLRLPLVPWPDGLDRRWRPGDVRDFLEKARQFAQESNFDEFIKTQQPMYDRAVVNLRTFLDKEANLEWFDDFFGTRPGAEFHIVLGMLNGSCNYGPHIKLPDKEEYYCILGVWKLDLGEPRFDKSMLPIVIHEFCHSYANKIVDAHISQLEKPGKKIYAKVAKKMERMAYVNWQTMMQEFLVRACVVRYMAATQGQGAAQRQIREEIDQSFFWMQELSDLLVQYEENRDKYKTLDTFFPKVVDFFNN